MTREELKEQLQKAGFETERNEEYHNDVFRHEAYGRHGLHLEVYVDYYNVRMVWWHQKGRKVAKNYYVKAELIDYESVESLIDAFVKSMIDTYGVSVSAIG